MSILLPLLLAGLQQVPLVNEPELIILEFNRSEAHNYFDGSNVFRDLWGVAFVNSSYGRFTFAADPMWHRLIYGRQGLKGLEILGADKFMWPWDITAYGNRIYVTDKAQGVIAEFEIIRPFPILPPQVAFVRYISLGTVGGVTKMTLPMGLAYSNAGTPDDLSDDTLYVADVSGGIIRVLAQPGLLIGEYPRTQGSFPLDVAVAKTVAEGSVVNTDTIYVLEGASEAVAVYESGNLIRRTSLGVRPYTI